MKLYFFIACTLLMMVKAGAQSISFPHVFAPQEGLTKPVEQPWRQEICLNGSWQFQPVALPQNFDIKNGTPLLPMPDGSAWSSTPIRIPSPWNVNAFTYTGGDAVSAECRMEPCAGKGGTIRWPLEFCGTL
jgi:hypothetical protein